MRLTEINALMKVCSGKECAYSILQGKLYISNGCIFASNGYMIVGIACNEISLRHTSNEWHMLTRELIDDLAKENNYISLDDDRIYVTETPYHADSWHADYFSKFFDYAPSYIEGLEPDDISYDYRFVSLLSNVFKSFKIDMSIDSSIGLPVFKGHNANYIIKALIYPKKR